MFLFLFFFFFFFQSTLEKTLKCAKKVYGGPWTATIVLQNPNSTKQQLPNIYLLTDWGLCKLEPMDQTRAGQYVSIILLLLVGCIVLDFRFSYFLIWHQCCLSLVLKTPFCFLIGKILKSIHLCTMYSLLRCIQVDWHKAHTHTHMQAFMDPTHILARPVLLLVWLVWLCWFPFLCLTHIIMCQLRWQRFSKSW